MIGFPLRFATLPRKGRVDMRALAGIPIFFGGVAHW